MEEEMDSMENSPMDKSPNNQNFHQSSWDNMDNNEDGEEKLLKMHNSQDRPRLILVRAKNIIKKVKYESGYIIRSKVG